jgi:hypothetical protein
VIAGGQPEIDAKRGVGEVSLDAVAWVCGPALVFSPFFVMPGPFNLLRMEKTENYATRKKKVTISFPSTIKMNNFFSRNTSSSCVCIFGIQRDFLSTLSSD